MKKISVDCGNMCVCVCVCHCVCVWGTGATISLPHNLPCGYGNGSLGVGVGAMTAIYFSALDNTRNLQLGRAKPARVTIREEEEQEMWCGLSKTSHIFLSPAFLREFY